MAPVVHGLEQAWGDRIQFAYLDIDDSRNNPFKQQLGYQYQPHFFLLDGQGEIVGQWIGYVAAEELEGAFQQVIE